jgi:hypothetical protein
MKSRVEIEFLRSRDEFAQGRRTVFSEGEPFNKPNLALPIRSRSGDSKKQESQKKAESQREEQVHHGAGFGSYYHNAGHDE